MTNFISPIILFVAVYATLIPCSARSYHSSPFDLSAADSVVFVQFGIDSAMVDSLLIYKLETSRFLFRYSPKFPQAGELRSKGGSYDAYCDTITSLLQLPKSHFKTVVYLYADSSEQFLCFKGWPQLRENQAVSLLREIHASGLLPIEHEIVHILFNDLVAHARSPFFAEGVALYVEYVRSDESSHNAIRIAKKYLPQPWEKWANDSIGFWATGDEHSIIVAYPVSGLFVKYLIQRYGLETFKDFYRCIRKDASTDVDAAFLITYGYSLSKAISDFKTTIASW